MPRQTFSIPLILLALAFPASAEEPSAEAPADDATLYALGAALAGFIAEYRLEEGELRHVIQGLEDAALDRPLDADPKDYQRAFQQLKRERKAGALEAQRASGRALADKMAARPGAERTDSGLVYIEERAGQGTSPGAEDRVTVHYHGTLGDGTVFDSSVARGKPATFALNRVIDCWTEGVQKMSPGAKATLVCPPDIAYGRRGAPPRIPPGATLVFEVELLEVQGQ